MCHKRCLVRTHTHTHTAKSNNTVPFLMYVQTGELIICRILRQLHNLRDLLLFFFLICFRTSVSSPPVSTGANLHQRFTEVTERKFKCPHRRSQSCWTTWTPPETLPTQSGSCSPAPAAFSAPCRPLLFLLSGRMTNKFRHWSVDRSVKHWLVSRIRLMPINNFKLFLTILQKMLQK